MKKGAFTFSILFIILLGNASFMDSKWELRKDEGGIKVYTKNISVRY